MNPLTLRSFARLVVFVTLGILGTFASAAENTGGQVWLLSTRRAPLSSPLGSPVPIDYWALGPDEAWLPSDEAAFHASDMPTMPTCIFIHGNRSEWQDAIDAGWRAYGQLKQQAGPQPFRFVIWSWPSEQVYRRNRPDAQEKAERSDGQAIYLAQWLDRLHPDVPVSLIGYSFGARIATGAMHLLGGGTFAGQSLPQTNPRQVPVRAVLVAAAEDFDWLLPGHCHGLALNQLERVLITVNGSDPALRWYRLMYGRGGPEALGYAGLCPGWVGPEAGKVEMLDLSCEVGRVHDWACYVLAPSLNARLGWYTFLAPATPPVAVAPAQ